MGVGLNIGGAVRFLLIDQARYITGQVLVVDGRGYACRSEPRLAVGWTEETRSRHDREGSSAGPTFARLLSRQR